MRWMHAKAYARGTMLTYRCYLLAAGRGIVGQRAFRAESDEQALALAWRLYRALRARQHGFELWRGNERIHSQLATSVAM
jgi:hypothetical protein